MATPTVRVVSPSLTGHDQLNDLLWETSTHVELMEGATFAGTPLTLASSGMLITIGGEPGITVAEMSRRIPKTQQAISQVAARLEKLGLVERRVGPGRGVGLHLTPAGEAMRAEASRREADLQVRLRELLGDARYDGLSTLLGEARAILRENR